MPCMDRAYSVYQKQDSEVPPCTFLYCPTVVTRGILPCHKKSDLEHACFTRDLTVNIHPQRI